MQEWNRERTERQRKTEDLTEKGVEISKNRGAVDIFGKKWIPRSFRNGQSPLVEMRQKYDHIVNGWSWLRSGVFCGLQ